MLQSARFIFSYAIITARELDKRLSILLLTFHRSGIKLILLHLPAGLDGGGNRRLKAFEGEGSKQRIVKAEPSPTPKGRTSVRTNSVAI